MSNESNFLFTKEHEWIHIDDNEAKVGVTDFAQSELGDIIFVELPEVGDSFDKDEVFGTIEAVKTVADLFMPVSGEIVSINSNIEDNPELINSKPFSEGWIIKIKIYDKNQANILLTKDKYKELINV